MKNERVWHLMLLSFFVPVLGGLIAYLLQRNKDRDLASICVMGSFMNPLLIGFVVGFVLGSFTNLLIIYAVIVFLGLAFNWVAIKSTFPDNPYRFFLPVFWFGIFGVAYAYSAYRQDKNLQNNVGWFFFFQLLPVLFALPFIAVLVSLA